MMQNLLISFNAVAPTFILLFLGYLLVQKKMVTHEFLSTANQLVFKIFFPCLLFHNIYRTDLRQVFNGTLFLFALGGLFLLFLLLCLLVPVFIQNRLQRGVIIQGIFRGNYLIFGVSMVTNLFGEEKAAVASMLSTAVIPVYNLLSVIALELFTGEQKPKLTHTMKSIVTNPLILSTIAAVVVSLSDIPVPQFLQTSIGDIAKMATPIALIVLGGDFDFENAKGNFKLAVSAVCIKLILLPAIVVPLVAGMGIRGAELLAVALVFGTPVAVSSYIMAQQAKADHRLAGQLVVISSCLCLPTIFLMIFMMKQFHWI